MSNIKELLTKEIEDQIGLMGDLEFGSEEYKVAADGLAKLMDRLAAIEKAETEKEDKEENRKIEAEVREAQSKAEKKDAKWRNGLTIAGIVVPAALTVWGTIKSIKFEETGTFTTIMGKGFINKLLPKR